MSKNRAVEEAIENVPEKDASALPLIERRLKALTEQRQRIAQQMQLLATEDVGCQGAIATLEAIRKELLTAEESNKA